MSCNIGRETDWNIKFLPNPFQCVVGRFHGLVNPVPFLCLRLVYAPVKDWEHIIILPCIWFPVLVYDFECQWL